MLFITPLDPAAIPAPSTRTGQTPSGVPTPDTKTPESQPTLPVPGC